MANSASFSCTIAVLVGAQIQSLSFLGSSWLAFTATATTAITATTAAPSTPATAATAAITASTSSHTTATVAAVQLQPLPQLLRDTKRNAHVGTTHG